MLVNSRVVFALVSVLAFSAASRVIFAQSTGVLSATVFDSLTGKPIVGARVTIWCPGCYGRWPTDTAGHFRRGSLPPGQFRLEFHCPSVTPLGAEILHRDVVISPNRETVVNVRVPFATCVEPKYSERTGIFRGYWTSGFEESRFFPCADTLLGVSAPLLPGRRIGQPSAWADLSSSAWPRSLKGPRGAPVDEYGNPTLFVTWHGVLKGPGSYGHLGVSEYSMVVDRVIAIKAKGPANCRTR